MEQTNPPTKNKNNPLPFFNRSLKPGAGGSAGPIKPIVPLGSNSGIPAIIAQRLHDHPNSRLNRVIPGV